MRRSRRGSKSSPATPSSSIPCLAGRKSPRTGALYRDEHYRIATTLKPAMGSHILTGPIAVRGARAGDTLEVRIKGIELTEDWAWNAIRPLRGALPEDFGDFQPRVIALDRSAMTATLPWGPTLPLEPFFGVLATAPRPEYGRISTVEPREFGGNMDCRELRVGTSVFLPIFVDGANFSAGDGHALQGDGEVCLTRAGNRAPRARSNSSSTLAWRSDPLARSRRPT